MGISNNNVEVVRLGSDFKMKKDLPNKTEYHKFSDDNLALQFFKSKIREYLGVEFEDFNFLDTDSHLIIEKGDKSLIMEHVLYPHNEKYHRIISLGKSLSSPPDDFDIEGYLSDLI
jgi:hypothetical protein